MLITLSALNLDWIAQLAGSLAIWFAARTDRPEPSTEERIAALTLKVRHPLRYRLTGWRR